MDISKMQYAEMPNNRIQQRAFFPELSLKELAENYALNSEYSSNISMMLEKLNQAIFFVNDELSVYKALNWSSFSTLESVEDERLNSMVDGESRLVTLYKKAVYSLAKAKILPSRLNTTNRNEAIAQQDKVIDNEHHLRKTAYAAIRQMQGQSKHITATLI